MATGFVALALANFAAQVSGFVIMVVLARRLTPGEIGSYAFALGLVGYFAIPANFGVTGLAIRDLAQRPHEARELMGAVTTLQLAVGFLPYLVLVALAPVLAVDEASRSILPIVGLGFVIEGLSFSWVLYGGSRFVTLAVARVAGAIAFAVGALVFVQPGPDAVLRFGWVTLAGIAATALMTFVVVLRHRGRPVLVSTPRQLARRFRAGVPLGVAAVMISIYYTLDSVMLGYFKDTATVGQYAVAYKIPLAVITIAALWGSVLFPHASDLAQRDRETLRRHLQAFASIACIVSFPLLAGSLVIGGDLMPALFGPRYAPAGTPFVLLMVAAALIVVTINYGTTAIAIGDERHYAIGVTLAAATNVVLNLALIPPFGMVGAAAATIAAEVVVFAYVFLRVRGILGHLTLEWERVARAAGATAVMLVALVAVDDLSPYARIAVGAAVVAAAGAALRVVRLTELRAAWSSSGPQVLP